MLHSFVKQDGKYRAILQICDTQDKKQKTRTRAS